MKKLLYTGIVLVGLLSCLSGGTSEVKIEKCKVLKVTKKERYGGTIYGYYYEIETSCGLKVCSNHLFESGDTIQIKTKAMKK